MGNRAIGAPINIWNDHSDAMAMRESGWIQLFAESNQEAADLHIVAFRLAEELSVPTMVCVDGFILTHAVERIDIPDQASVDAFLPPYEPMQSLDPADPISIGAMVGPDAFTEVRYLQYFKQHSGARPHREPRGRIRGTLRPRRPAASCDTYKAEDAETLVVAMGSINGTIKDVIDEMRADGLAIGLVTLVAFRPFPADALQAGAGAGAATSSSSTRRSTSAWAGRSRATSRSRCATLPRRRRRCIRRSSASAAGRCPRPRCTGSSVRRRSQPWEGPHFLDLNERVVARELHRRGKTRRVGPTAEAILKQLEVERVEKLAERTS